MSEIKVSKLTNRAGTGAPDFSQGVKIEGTASTLLAPTRTEGATEPTSPSNGDTWYDTDNDTYDVYINDEWKRFIGAGGGAVSWTVDISNLSYDSVSLSIASQDGLAMSVAFNTDGTKMYMIGTASDSVHQYSLSTGFDLSTASYDSVSFSTASQEGVARSVRFNTDGTKMYIVGTANDTAYQYSLSTAFDISTASYDSVSLSVNQDGTPFELGFNSDGTKMYMLGYGADIIYQYSLSTAFDLSTGSYDSVSFSFNSQDTAPSSFAFNTDGTKMYLLGNTNDTIYQYSLSTGFDISTASYDSVSFSVNSQDTAPNGIAFSADGTKMYLVGNTNDTIYQYSTGL